MPVVPEDLTEAAAVAAAVLQQLDEADGEVRAGDLEWSCRQTLAHVAQLGYAGALARRATGPLPLVLVASAGASMPDLVDGMLSMSAVLSATARADPAARGFHAAGRADAEGFLAMAMDEILVHTHDIASGLGRPFVPPDRLARRVLDRLFPWWPRDHAPWAALLWANGRGFLPGQHTLGAEWLWHCAPLDEWDGTIPRWDPQAGAKVT